MKDTKGNGNGFPGRGKKDVQSSELNPEWDTLRELQVVQWSQTVVIKQKVVGDGSGVKL